MRCYYSYGWLLATIIFCLDVQARDVKIVEGQQEEMKTQQWLDHDGYDDYYESNEGSFYGQQLEDGMDGGDLSAPQERGEGQGSDYNYSQE